MKGKKIYIIPFLIIVFVTMFLTSNTLKVKTIENIQDIVENTSFENTINEQLPKIDYTNSKTINNIKYEIIPQTAQKRLSLVLGKNEINEEDLKEANKLICYELRIQNIKNSNFLKQLNSMENDIAIKYFSNDMKNDIKLIVSDDTLSCNLFHFERTFGVVPYLSFQLGFQFDKSWKNKPHHLIFEDSYFENGEIHLVNTYK